MVFIEPTPYVLDLLEKGFDNLNKIGDVVFLKQNFSQNWNLQSRLSKYFVSLSIIQIAKLYIDIFFKRKYSLVHVAGWSNPHILFLILASRLFFYPVTVESDTQFNQNISRWKKIIKKGLYPILFKFPKYFLPGGIRQEKYLVHYGVNPKKIIHAQMTVNVEYIQGYIKKIASVDREKLRTSYDIGKNDVVFLFVGRLLNWKGIRELIDAFKLIDKPNAKLWIVGNGDLAEEVKISSEKNTKIKYLGRIGDDRLWNVYHAADVFVIPSHHEPWGLVVNEAMAVGLPIIATDNVGCVDDLILQNREGLVIRPKDIVALTEAMHFMLSNPEKRVQMSNNAACTIQSWTLKNEAGNMMTAWKAVMMEKCRRAYS